jgi:hypothetical protein
MNARSEFEADHEYRDAAVVAMVWLAFYVVMAATAIIEPTLSEGLQLAGLQ